MAAGTLWESVELFNVPGVELFHLNILSNIESLKTKDLSLDEFVK